MAQSGGPPIVTWPEAKTSAADSRKNHEDVHDDAVFKQNACNNHSSEQKNKANIDI